MKGMTVIVPHLLGWVHCCLGCSACWSADLTTLPGDNHHQYWLDQLYTAGSRKHNPGKSWATWKLPSWSKWVARVPVPVGKLIHNFCWLWAPPAVLSTEVSSQRCVTTSHLQQLTHG